MLSNLKNWKMNKDLILAGLISTQVLMLGMIYFTNESKRLEQLEERVEVIEVQIQKVTGLTDEAIKFCNWAEVPLSYYVARNRNQSLRNGEIVKYPTWDELKNLRIKINERASK